MDLTDPARTQRDDVLSALDELCVGQIEDQLLVERGDDIEVERLQAFYGWEPGALMRRSTMRASRSINSNSISRAG